MVESTHRVEQIKLDAGTDGDNGYVDFRSQLQRQDWSAVSAVIANSSAGKMLDSTKFAITDDTRGTSGPVAPPRWEPPKQGEFATNDEGDPLDPVNFYFHGSLDDVRAAFEKAGWTKAADKITPSVTDADKWPMSSLYYPGADGKLKPEVIGYNKGTSWDRSTRNHLRVFDTGKVDETGQQVWAVAASRDNGYQWSSPVDVDVDVDCDPFPPVCSVDVGVGVQMPAKHTKDPITDEEREYVLQSLKDVRMNADVETLKLNFKENADGTSKDGVVYDVWLGGRPGPKYVGPSPKLAPGLSLLT